jgi:DNA-directed RNA polymerase I subunit RPA2
MNCSDYSTAWVCRTCGSLITLGYDDVSLGEVIVGTSESSHPRPTAPSGEYCRVCRAEAEEADEKARRSLGGEGEPDRSQKDVHVTIPRHNLLGRTGKGGDMDVIAVPYVFRYLCAELASMGIRIAVGVQ